MKLYTFAPAANALRVEMFLREKELKLETISVNKEKMNCLRSHIIQ
jgi:hypothetical protein